MIEIKAVIEKSDIVPVDALKDRLNSDEFEVDGVTYHQRTAMFKGFAGTMELPSRKFVGVYQFEPLQNAWGDEPVKTMRVADLPKAGANKTAKPAAKVKEHPNVV